MGEVKTPTPASGPQENVLVKHEAEWVPADLIVNAAGDTEPGFVCAHVLENGNGLCSASVMAVEDAVGPHSCFVVEAVPPRPYRSGDLDAMIRAIRFAARLLIDELGPGGVMLNEPESAKKVWLSAVACLTSAAAYPTIPLYVWRTEREESADAEAAEQV